MAGVPIDVVFSVCSGVCFNVLCRFVVVRYCFVSLSIVLFCLPFPPADLARIPPSLPPAPRPLICTHSESNRKG